MAARWQVIFTEGIPAFDPRSVSVPGYATGGGFGRRGDSASGADLDLATAPAVRTPAAGVLAGG
jgi:hypothetical protein